MKVVPVILCFLIGAEMPVFSQEGVDPAVVDPCSYKAKSAKATVPDLNVCGATGYSGPGIPSDTHYLYASSDRYAGPRVGILKKSSDGKVLLNPPPPYQQLVSVSGLSLIELEKLWGPATESPNSKAFKTFSLWGFWTIDKREKNLYHVDAKFINNKFCAYRVRGFGIAKPEWKSFEQERESAI